MKKGIKVIFDYATGQYVVTGKDSNGKVHIKQLSLEDEFVNVIEEEYIMRINLV